MRPALLALALAASGCASLAELQAEKVATYHAEQSRLFVTRLAQARADPRKADVQALVTADAINEPLSKLERKGFTFGAWTFTPTRAPRVVLKTGSALLEVTGDVRKGEQRAEVTLVGGLAVRWNEDGSHLYLKPSALAVVPTLKVSVLDLALGSVLRSLAEGKAGEYLEQRVGEIDVPVRLMLPFQRKAVTLDHTLESPDEPGTTLRYELPGADAQVKLDQLFVWPLEGRIAVVAHADVVRVTPVMEARP